MFESCASPGLELPQSPGSAAAAGSRGSSVTLETVIRGRESIIHGKGRLMYRRDRQTDTAVSNSQPAISYPLVSTHKARRSEHTVRGSNRGNKSWGGGRLDKWRGKSVSASRASVQSRVRRPEFKNRVTDKLNNSF